MARIYLTPQQEQHPLFMFKLLISNDTGWENLYGSNIRGRIKNGIATLVFEGFAFNGTPGADTLMYTIPQRYWPSAEIYFSVFSNSTEPVAYGCRIQLTGDIRAYARNATDNVIGCISYPVK